MTSRHSLSAPLISKNYPSLLSCADDFSPMSLSIAYSHTWVTGCGGSTCSQFKSWRICSVWIGRENANTVPSSTPVLSISRISSTIWWLGLYLWVCMRFFVIFGWYMKLEYHEINSWSTGGVFRRFQNLQAGNDFFFIITHIIGHSNIDTFWSTYSGPFAWTL